MERESRRVDSFAEQPLDPDLVIVLVTVLCPDQDLPHNQTPLGRREERVTVLDHKPASISSWSAFYHIDLPCKVKLTCLPCVPRTQL